MELDLTFGARDFRAIRRAIGAVAVALTLPLLAGCGSSKAPPPVVVTGSTTTCVPMGATISCSCTPVPPQGS
jgi:hypothetical protein